MKRITKRLEYVIAVMLAVVTVLTANLMKSDVRAFADSPTVAYTDVLTDLKQDPNFKVSDYKSNAADFSLQLIQIAESEAKELFLYVYQPAADAVRLTATAINMAATADGNKDSIYKLTLLNRNGVFAKYIVNDFEVVIPGIEADEPSSRIVGDWTIVHTRYYNITSIFREWNKYADGETGNGNVTNAVAYPVGQEWKVTNPTDNTIRYSMTATEIIDVNTEYTGFLRYSDGFQFEGTQSTDAHFYAFSTRYKIDRLRAASMSFETTAYTQLAGQQPKEEKPVPHNIELYGVERENDGSGWFGKKYTWNELSSTEDFVTKAEAQGYTFDPEPRKKILNEDWIINFYQTPYTCDAGGKDVLISAFIPFGFIWTIINSLTTSGEYVSNVTLLRLEYNYDGEIYNVGVVSNMVTGSKDPVNGSDSFDFWKWLSDSLFAKRTPWVWVVTCVVVLVAVMLVSWIIRGILDWRERRTLTKQLSESKTRKKKK